MFKILTAITIFIAEPMYSQSKLVLGQEPSSIVLAAGNGGVLKNDHWNMWSSTEGLKGKVHVVLYVAPSKKSLNQHIVDKLKEKKYPLDKIQTLVIVNTAPSWWPESILDTKIRSNQKESPRAIYLKDTQHTIAKAWGLEESSHDIFVFNEQGKTIFTGYGAFSNHLEEQFFSLLDHHASAKTGGTPPKS
ncbi:MAG: YtfJ family protein [Oligoflexales bacterium]